MIFQQLRDDLLKKSTLAQMGKFGLVGGTGMGINLGLLWVLTELLDVYYMYSAVIAIIVAGFWNFIWNKYWTFGKSSVETSRITRDKRNAV